jgi:hypothetical protein
LALIPKHDNKWSLLKSAGKSKVMKVYYRMKNIEAVDKVWKGLSVLMMKVAQLTAEARTGQMTTRNSRTSASEMYRLAYLMQDAGARAAWTKAYMSKDDRLEYENNNDPFDVIAEMYK